MLEDYSEPTYGQHAKEGIPSSNAFSLPNASHCAMCAGIFLTPSCASTIHPDLYGAPQ